MCEVKNVSVQVGPGLPALLFLVFLVLKLTGFIGWSWWLVTAPLWGPLAIVIAVAVVAGFVWAVLTLAILAWEWVEGRWRARRDA